MPYELIKKFVVENLPCPCHDCIAGWGYLDSKGNNESCQDSCEKYQASLHGKIVTPYGFDEVRKI